MRTRPPLPLDEEAAGCLVSPLRAQAHHRAAGQAREAGPPLANFYIVNIVIS